MFRFRVFDPLLIVAYTTKVTVFIHKAISGDWQEKSICHKTALLGGVISGISIYQGVF
ncbi:MULTISPECIES: hypothetical protein [unclassified Bartonella]|uniref:hypothetical protein n=1 Tax=unclassified Bartonella TaxID=2645622 RepID=UPI0035D0B8A5